MEEIKTDSKNTYKNKPLKWGIIGGAVGLAGFIVSVPVGLIAVGAGAVAGYLPNKIAKTGAEITANSMKGEEGVEIKKD